MGRASRHAARADQTQHDQHLLGGAGLHEGRLAADLALPSLVPHPISAATF
jgi:hypothetical protein